MSYKIPVVNNSGKIIGHLEADELNGLVVELSPDKFAVHTQVPEGINAPIYDFNSNMFIDTLPPNTTLNRLKEIKVNELSAECQNSIIYGFVASNGHGYRLKIEDQLNMEGAKNRLINNPNQTEMSWMNINDDVVSHTRQEFIDLTEEAFVHKQTQIFKNKQLRDMANNATSEAELEAIHWDMI